MITKAEMDKNKLAASGPLLPKVETDKPVPAAGIPGTRPLGTPPVLSGSTIPSPVSPPAGPAPVAPLLPKMEPPQSAPPTRVEQEIVAEEHAKMEEVAAESDRLRREIGVDPVQHVNISRRMSMLQEQGQLNAMADSRKGLRRITALSPEGVAQFVHVPSESHKGPPGGPPAGVLVRNA